MYRWYRELCSFSFHTLCFCNHGDFRCFLLTLLSSMTGFNRFFFLFCYISCVHVFISIETLVSNTESIINTLLVINCWWIFFLGPFELLLDRLKFVDK